MTATAARVSVAHLLAHVRELEAALADQRAIAEQERRRADAEREASRVAWRVASGGRRPPSDGGPFTT
jgi:hypothetical protein